MKKRVVIAGRVRISNRFEGFGDKSDMASVSKGVK